MTDVFEMARHYYQDFTPPLWPLSRLQALVKAGKLTAEQVEEITGEASSHDPR